MIDRDWRKDYARYQELREQLRKLDDEIAVETWAKIVKNFVIGRGEIPADSTWAESLRGLYFAKKSELRKKNGQ